MATYKYTFNQVDIQQVVSTDTYSVKDVNLINSFSVNSSFDELKNYSELHYYSLDGQILNSIPRFNNFKSAQDSGTANNGTLDSITLKLEEDLLAGGYDYGDVYLLYNFLNDPYTDNSSKSEFFIEEISQDRFEIRLLSKNLSNDKILKYTADFKKKFSNPDFSDFRLNLGNNRFLLTTNIDTLKYKEFISVVIRLYNPLPGDITVKDVLTVAEVVSDSIAFNAVAETIPDIIQIPYLKGPNFNAGDQLLKNSPTKYFSLNELFSYPVTNSYYEVRSLFNEKGAELTIDHTDYSDFIHFSSARERLDNFKYKLDLITTYQSESNAKSNLAASLNLTASLNAYSGSQDYYKDLIENILNNFDHYDRYLYYESSSFSWPKTNDTKPYVLDTGATGISWYNGQAISASLYDQQNPHHLINSIPSFLREDPNNSKYLLFLNMIGQHFDNLWLYAKNITDKYDGDNRLNFGISKDLLENALQNFGIRLYQSNKSTQELFSMFTGIAFSTGSESYVDTIITGSNEIVSEENYRKQIYKRLYHNLPYLLKTKGTERGLRALLSVFGIPSLYSSGSFSGLKIHQYGGGLSGSYNLGNQYYTTSSLGKIRIDNTGSIIPSGSYTSGNTLSRFVSIIKPDKKYSNDLNVVEVGFSPANYLNEFIISSASTNSFDIDSILGDPRLAYSSSYSGLQSKAEEYLAPVITLASANNGTVFNLKDFTRLLKYYDNILFKTIRDFVPARANVNTGIIIKPHLLERSKAKQVRATFEQHNEYSASIEVGSYSGSSGNTFGGRDQHLTYYTEYVPVAVPVSGSTTEWTSSLAPVHQHKHEEAKYDGEFSGSFIRLTTGELNDENLFKYDEGTTVRFKYNFVNAGADCLVTWGEHTAAVQVSATPSPTVTPTITPTISVTPTITSTPGATQSPTPSITPTRTVTPSITPTRTVTPTVTPSNTPPYVQQWADFYIDSTAYSNVNDACSNASLGTHVFFTSSIGTAFSDLITAVQGGTPVSIFTNSSLTTAFTSTTQWHAADSTGPSATYALLVNSSGDVGAAQSCVAVTPTPTTSPSRAFVGLRNDGSNSPAVGWDTSTEACTSGVASIVPENYVEFADYQTPLAINTQIYAGSSGATAFDGGDKYWLSEDQTYAYRIGANGLVSQAISCTTPTPTPTPTLTPTPTTSTSFYSFDVWYDSEIASGDLTTCAQTGSNITVYSTDSSITVTETVLLSSQDITDFAPIGWYAHPASAPTMSYSIESTSGLVEDSRACVVAPTPTPSPSPPPCYFTSAQTSTVSSGDTCFASFKNVYHDGATLATSTIIYTANCAGTQGTAQYINDGTNMYYWDGSSSLTTVANPC